MTTRVELSHDGGVSRVRFVGEKGIQLLTADTRSELAAAVTELENRPECSVVVFESEGRVFIAGADIKELATLDAESARHCANETHRLFERIEQLPAVTIAAIHGACAGGGFELSLSCDLRFAAEPAKIGLPEVTLGLIPGWGGTVRMTRLFGPAIAKYVILRGELLPASEALRLGIVDGVAPENEFREFVQRQIDLLLQRSPNAIRTAKSLIHKLSRENDHAAFAAEANAFSQCYDFPEAREGIAAFLEKRPPNWNA